jgi:hypothetical protein
MEQVSAIAELAEGVVVGSALGMSGDLRNASMPIGKANAPKKPAPRRWPWLLAAARLRRSAHPACRAALRHDFGV